MAIDIAMGAAKQQALVQLVCFYIENEEYAVDILHVQEILRIREMTRVLKSQAYIKGVINKC